jgi:hypothetical protein
VRSVKGSQQAAYALLEPGSAATLTATLGIAHQTVTDVAATLRTRGRHEAGAHLTALLTLPSGKHRTIGLHAVKRHPGEYRADTTISLVQGTLPFGALVRATKGHQSETALATGVGACTTKS